MQIVLCVRIKYLTLILQNPMYGQVEDESVMGSPRSATTAFSFVPPDDPERRPSQSHSTDTCVPSAPSYIVPWDEWEVNRDRFVHLIILSLMSNISSSVFHSSFYET